MHTCSDVAWSSAPRHQLGFGRFRASIDELRRAAVASERYVMLRSLGLTRTTVCLRVSKEFYSMANVYERRG
jgi:hypothetical protein